MKTNRYRVGILIAAALLFILSIGTAAVFAQATDEVNTGLEDPNPMLPRGGSRFWRRPGRSTGNELQGPIARLQSSGIDHGQLLADALDISLDELHQAQQEARGAGILLALEEEIITQDEADLLLAFMSFKGSLDYQALVAEVLGLSVDELAQAREDGSRLRDLLGELEMSPEDFREGLREAFEAAVGESVSSGDISEVQGELILNFKRPARFFPRAFPQRPGQQRDRGF